MDNKKTNTLLDLAIHQLLSNEPAAIHALKEIPKELFVPLLSAAFKGVHKNIVKAMIQVWPFTCLHIGTLSVQGPHRELLTAMVKCLQIIPVQDPDSRSSKLRILDLREDSGCKIICPEISAKSPACLFSCVHSEHSILKMGAQYRNASSEPEVQPSNLPMELIVNISLRGGNILREREYLALLLNKVEQSSGSLHLCCRDLEIDKLSVYNRNTLNRLGLKCLDHLSVFKGSLREITYLLAQVVHLRKLCLSKVTCSSLNGKVFQNFVSQLRFMDHLNELNFDSFDISDHLETVLRVLPTSLDFLHLTFCELSYKDFKFLAECPQVKHLKLLNISHNPICWEDCEPLINLLNYVSGTLQHLEFNHCLLRDSAFYGLIPALTHCSHLQVLNFFCNPVSMSMLMRLLEHLTPLMELKHVIYPIPVHCYGRWQIHDSLDWQKLANVQAQLKQMVQEAGRSDMTWITYPE
uniref:melanoma antigen preferentially expressed in tumors-like n=1 Tax=Myodes glareolus TaxID=447135 RepID=UPI0020207508|nr:melanoma antigen preferentially expressed in tumors-like [Myodes glareolus]XP_048295156.1 melanoma antigen preferentially expressed in tumors-like [Myodes glareolus]